MPPDPPSLACLRTHTYASRAENNPPSENPGYGPEMMPHFDKEFKCDPTKPHHGFTSWDDFFTREFRNGVRPTEAPNDDTVVVNACEAAPYKLATDVKRRDKFWIKSQPYSLEHMLANDPLVDKFVGGTIYQAYLSTYSYHRWHSPVSGKVIKIQLQDGSYYSDTLAEGLDPTGTWGSQAYLTEVATRAMVFIEADNPHIGLMCFLAVGMSEVSTYEITVYEGQRIEKGQQTGMFHFGGSTPTVAWYIKHHLYTAASKQWQTESSAALH